MKTNHHHLIPAGLAAALLAPAIAIAIEPPADDTPPPAGAWENAAPAAAVPQAPPAGDRARINEVQPAAPAAFIGVVTAQIPEMLTTHLAIEPGQGVIVRAVLPDGPAAAAGIAVHDIITHIDEVAVDSPAGLTRQIAGHKPGDTVSVGLIQKGKPTEISIALGERPANDQANVLRALPGGQMLEDLMLDGLPNDQLQRLQGLIERNLGGLAQPDGRPMQDVMEEMRRRMDEMMKNGLPGLNENGGNLRFQADATVRLMDDQGSIEVRSRDGGKEVTLRDKDNEVTWTGPWDTEQDKAAAPAGVRERIEALNLEDGPGGQGLRFRMRPGGPALPGQD
jgi:serine protease Do